MAKTIKSKTSSGVVRRYHAPEPEVFEFEDPELIKRRLENKAFRHVEEQLDSGSAKANVLAKMILEPKHYNKTKLSLSLSLGDMNSTELLGHMGKLLDESA